LHGVGPAMDDLRSLCAGVLSLLPATPRRTPASPPRVFKLRPTCNLPARKA
jgi:hypothetical protein